MRVPERPRRWLVLAGLLALAVRPALAADPPVERAVLDQQIYDALKDVHNKGAQLHNAGDPAGCYRIFQALLMTVKPLLGHKPDVQQTIDKGLADADKLPSIPQRAMELHKTIEAVRTALKPASAKPAPPAASGVGPKLTDASKPEMPPSVGGVVGQPATLGQPPAPTLWKRLGGQDKVEKVVDEFVEAIRADPKVNLTRNAKYKMEGDELAAFKRKLVGYLSSISEGTVVYTGRSMADAHAGMMITPEEYAAMAAALRIALEKNNVAAADVDAVMKAVAAAGKDIVGKP
jgi:hemoglobin